MVRIIGFHPIDRGSSPRGGTFSAAAGLLFADVSSNIGSSTGEIDLANSTSGTYTIRYEIDATCFVEKQVDIGLMSTVAAIDPSNANASNNYKP